VAVAPPSRKFSAPAEKGARCTLSKRRVFDVHYHRRDNNRLAHFVAQAIRTELKTAGKGQCVGWPGAKQLWEQIK
jgi:hypothetical protein